MLLVQSVDSCIIHMVSIYVLGTYLSGTFSTYFIDHYSQKFGGRILWHRAVCVEWSIRRNQKRIIFQKNARFTKSTVRNNLRI